MLKRDPCKLCVYHCVEQLDASLQFRSGLAEKAEEKSSDRLFLTDAEIVPVCKKKKPIKMQQNAHRI